MTRHELEQAILELVDSADDMPRTDVQGVAMAIAMKAIEE